MFEYNFFEMFKSISKSLKSKFSSTGPGIISISYSFDALSARIQKIIFKGTILDRIAMVFGLRTIKLKILYIIR